MPVAEPVDQSKKSAVDRELVARLVGDAQRDGVAIDGEGGLLAEPTRLVLESALEGELTAHLGYEKHERAGDEADGNAQNGTRGKTVLTKAGPVQIEVPRDRAGTFEPAVVRKRQRRLRSIEDIVLSLSARGMTHGDISAHLADVYGSDVSKTTISTITDKVLEGMAEWQSRPSGTSVPRNDRSQTVGLRWRCSTRSVCAGAAVGGSRRCGGSAGVVVTPSCSGGLLCGALRGAATSAVA